MFDIKITGIGAYIPDYIETSKALASKINKTEEWINSRTGVRERRISTIDVDQMGAFAAKQAIKNSTPPDLIINASGVPKQTIPDSSVFIQKEMGYRDIPSFSIHATCLSFIVAFNTASSFIQSGQYQKILIVSSDRGSLGRNFSEPESAALLGDAAVAITLERSKGESKLLSFKMNTFSDGALLTQVKGGGTFRHPDNPQTISEDHYFTMDGPKVYKMARRKVYDMIFKILEENNITISDVDLLIPHQASLMAVRAYTKYGGFEEHKVINIIEQFGNCVAASVPLALYIAHKEGKIKRGNTLLMIGTGAGLSVAGCLFTY